jgi:hypothetical protein
VRRIPAARAAAGVVFDAGRPCRRMKPENG